jgi:hypothetical protein
VVYRKEGRKEGLYERRTEGRKEGRTEGREGRRKEEITKFSILFNSSLLIFKFSQTVARFVAPIPGLASVNGQIISSTSGACCLK